MEGIRLGTTGAGIRNDGEQIDRDDLAVIEIVTGSSTAAVFTQNKFCAAPVAIAKEHLTKTSPRYLLINSGNANAGTGSDGYHDCLETCRLLAQVVSCRAEEILPFSTGVIGQRMLTSLFEKALPDAVNNLSPDGWAGTANAIMTTDTRPKQALAKCQIKGKTFTLQGIAKGSGMIRPNMATMLAYVATDAIIDTVLLNKCLQQANSKSFNRITVDGDTSTNDACVLIATGKSGVEITQNDKESMSLFQNALEDICTQLAKAIVKDGEGATKFITIEVNGGINNQECLDVAYTIAHSPLVKTAFFASDPNWGRLVAAIGRSGIDDLDLQALSIKLGDVSLIESGEPASNYTEEAGAAVMAEDEITIQIELNRGSCSDTVWTCDLSYDYVRINAEYRT